MQLWLICVCSTLWNAFGRLGFHSIITGFCNTNILVFTISNEIQLFQKPRVTQAPSLKLANGVGNNTAGKLRLRQLLNTKQPHYYLGQKFIPKKINKAARKKKDFSKQTSGKKFEKQQKILSKKNTSSKLCKLKVSFNL